MNASIQLAIALSLIGTLIGSATTHAASTELQSFQRQVDRSAPSALDPAGFPERPKATCVCMVGGNAGRAGVLRQTSESVAGTTFVRVECLVRRFDASGNDTGYAGCGDFVPLPK